VLAFENGREALDGLQKCEHPCLILLDLMMPVMDGWQFLQERRRLGDIVASIPVVVVSAVADRAQARDSGVRDYVKKPVDLDILFRVVHEHCPLAARAS
jgi:CheY-like chemotaxis protein